MEEIPEYIRKQGLEHLWNKKVEPVNDAHDNAGTDREMLRRVQTNLAIEAFRKMELKRLQLEMAEYALTKLLNGTTDTDRYFTETEQIRHQMELKRADYARLGKLSKEETQTAEEIIQGLRDQLAAAKPAQPADTYTQRTGQAHDPGAGPFPHGYGQP
jgi:hypothetical protein